MRSKAKRRSRSGKKCGSQIAIKSNPRLWESVKKKIKSGTKGGPAGKWSARKSQLAVAEYKKRGGKYKGKKSKCNSLSKWSREKWGYVKGSNPKSRRGRYLPEKVRKMLTPSERRSENKRKGSKRGKWVPYSRSVSRKMRKAGIY